MQDAKLKVFLDTNIVVDYLNKRHPFFDRARLLMVLGYVGEIELWVSSSQFSDLVYILSNGASSYEIQLALGKLQGLRQFVNVFATSETQIDKMLLTTWKDPEDFIIYECALDIQANAIISRDKCGFENTIINVFNCEEFFDWLTKTGSVDYEIVDFIQAEAYGNHLN